MLGAFALTVYIGLFDKSLSTYQPLHWDLNWLFAAADLVAAIFLFGFPRKMSLVLLSGVIWPILYVVSLAIDVYTRLCLGGNQTDCWPSRTAAFNYLVLNNPNVANGYGWKLWQGSIPTTLGLLAGAFVLSAISMYLLSRKPRKSSSSTRDAPTQPSPASTQTELKDSR